MNHSNEQFADLYGDAIKPFVQLPADATLEDIKKYVDANNPSIEHRIKIGNRCIIAGRKYTWKGNVAKTSYLHIIHVKNVEGRLFEDWKNLNRRTHVLTHWREQKDGNFKTI